MLKGLLVLCCSIIFVCIDSISNKPSLPFHSSTVGHHPRNRFIVRPTSRDYFQENPEYAKYISIPTHMIDESQSFLASSQELLPSECDDHPSFDTSFLSASDKLIETEVTIPPLPSPSTLESQEKIILPPRKDIKQFQHIVLHQKNAWPSLPVVADIVLPIEYVIQFFALLIITHLPCNLIQMAHPITNLIKTNITKWEREEFTVFTTSNSLTTPTQQSFIPFSELFQMAQGTKNEEEDKKYAYLMMLLYGKCTLMTTCFSYFLIQALESCKDSNIQFTYGAERIVGWGLCDGHMDLK